MLCLQIGTDGRSLAGGLSKGGGWLISIGLDENWPAFYSTAAGQGHRVCEAHNICYEGVWDSFSWSLKRDSMREKETERWWWWWEGKTAKTENELQQRGEV